MPITDEQGQAIKARGEVLVSASAGAGKTTVMIARLADILQEEASLDDVVAVTFTKKAAAQMKEKLRGELIKRLDCADPVMREKVRVQLGKINTADISTIDSFCARLVRTYFYALKVDASFEILADATEEKMLRAHAMDDLFERMYAENDPKFMLLLEKLRKKRSDKALREKLYNAYDEIRLRPDFKAVLEKAGADVFTDKGFERITAEWGELLFKEYALMLETVENLQATFHPAVNEDKYQKVLEEMHETLASLIDNKTVYSPPPKLCVSQKPRVKPEVAEDDAYFANVVKKIRDRYEDIIKHIGEEQEEKKNFIASGELAEAFLYVLKAFVEAYDGVKREEGKLDYADLEHYALALLKGEDCDADVRESIREKYKYVFVDEYQDVNPIQDEIISALTSKDVFCVGDLKQAIYGFRGSRSRFFAEKCRSVGDSEKGKYIVLPDNFRSAGNVISFVNRLFSKVMKPPVFGFDYAENHAMRGGSGYAEGYDGIAEVCLYEIDEKEKQKAESVYSVTDATGEVKRFSAEGKAVLRLIKEALNSEYYDPERARVKDKDGNVHIEPERGVVKVQTGDICVLTRKKDNAAVQELVRVVSSEYPVASAAETNVCDRPEIKRLLDVLSYIDNGEQDIPLAAALLSPVGGFTERELAVIRIFGGTGIGAPSFRECCRLYADKKEDGIAEKLNLFFERIERFRILSDSVGAARIIDEIMQTDNFSAAYNTQNKLSAVRRLQSEAYTPSGELYLNAFLAKIKASGNKVTAPSALASDCVKVMTMHASKGLEFPVVIIADIASTYEGQKVENIPFDDDFGFAPKYYDDKSRKSAKTVLGKLYAARKVREEINNEINLFYVACTRAKYALHVLSSKAESYNVVKAYTAKNYADMFDVLSFDPRILPDESQENGNSGNNTRTLDESRADKSTLDLLEEISAYSYPYALGVELPVKSSASGILNTISADENAQPLFDDEIMRDAKTGIDAGITYHRFLELCDFSATDPDSIEKQIARWRCAGLITDAQDKTLDRGQLASILQMPALNGLAGCETYREREFICHLPSYEYLSLLKGGSGFSVGEDDGNGVIIQGAIDLLVVERKDGKAVGAHIIDYKYTAHSDDYVVKKYAPQLALYKCAVSKIYGIEEDKVKTTILNIRACRQIKM